MKTRFILLLIFMSTFLSAQERYFLKSDTRLYTSNSTSSSFLGYFKYGAEIQLLSENENGWYKVKSDNLSEGFVPAKFVSKTLNAADVYTKDNENPVLYGGDGSHGGNHLFILGAGIKARALPDKTSKLKEILTCGEAVSVNYSPLNSEEWVNISGSFNPEYARYVQRKYLGNCPDFDELMKQFDKLAETNIVDRKTISERLVELAWNNQKSKLITAYDKYYSVIIQLNDKKLLAETELNMLLAKKQSVEKNYEKIIPFSEKIELIIKGAKSKNYTISLKDLLKTCGKPTKTKRISDECGVYLSDLFYYYADLEVSVDEKQNLVELITVKINGHNKLLIDNTILDNSTNEKDFIIQYGDYIDTYFKSPHVYYFSLDDGSSIAVEFIDGKLYQVKINFDC
jgi:hypothetical protein